MFYATIRRSILRVRGPPPLFNTVLNKCARTYEMYESSSNTVNSRKPSLLDYPSAVLSIPPAASLSLPPPQKLSLFFVPHFSRSLAIYVSRPAHTSTRASLEGSRHTRFVEAGASSLKFSSYFLRFFQFSIKM